MKKKLMLMSILSVFLFFISVGQSVSFAEEKEEKQLLYDLKYDKEKSVLSGKSLPNSNIFINNLAGSIVADDKGDFEIPIPKEFKTSTVRMLDAIGEESTDVTFDFEKNTVINEATDVTSSTSSSSKVSESASSSIENTEEEESSSVAETKESNSTKSSTQKKSSYTSESYTANEKEPVRSKAWLWTLLAILVICGLAVISYFWYKNKIEKEENRRRTKKRKHGKKKSTGKSLEDEEDALYASIINGSKDKESTKQLKNKPSDDQMDLDTLIDSELKKTSTKNRHKKEISKKKDSPKKKTKK